MVEDCVGQSLSSELALGVVEKLALTSFQLALMDADIAAETAAEVVERKSRDRDAELMRGIAILRSLPRDVPEWVSQFSSGVDLGSRESVRSAYDSIIERAGSSVAPRARALMVLIDVVIFDPWSGKSTWNADQRESQLSTMAGYLSALEPRDLATVKREHTASIRAVRQRSARLGDFTVSTLAQLPDSVGDALTSVGTWLKSFDTDVVADAVRADLMTRLVALEAEHDDEKAKRVVQSIQERLSIVMDKQEMLTAKLRETRTLNQWLGAENRELRKQLQQERERAQLAEAALRTALDHIFGAVPALPAATQDGPR